jgi:predicted nucleic acid-binding protein
MAAGVVLDTSFLISLADPERVNHHAARQYWRYFLEQRIPVYLPTIVVSEFCIRQEIPPEILRACVTLPFNWEDAIRAASLDFSQTERNVPRDALKDDVKIIAQALEKDAEWIITDDENSMCKFVNRIREEGKGSCKALYLGAGFSVAHFNAGQHQIEYGDDDVSDAEV